AHVVFRHGTPLLVECSEVVARAGDAAIAGRRVEGGGAGVVAFAAAAVLIEDPELITFVVPVRVAGRAQIRAGASVMLRRAGAGRVAGRKRRACVAAAAFVSALELSPWSAARDAPEERRRAAKRDSIAALANETDGRR